MSPSSGIEHLCHRAALAGRPHSGRAGEGAEFPQYVSRTSSRRLRSSV